MLTKLAEKCSTLIVTSRTIHSRPTAGHFSARNSASNLSRRSLASIFRYQARLPRYFEIQYTKNHRYYTTNMDLSQPQQPVLITTPIFYVNGSPHIGHLYSVLLGDALARWHRLKGHPTLFTVGTDEHGIKVQEAAQKQGKDLKEFCDEVTTTFSDLWHLANISYDDYIRTTEERHKQAVNHIWKLLAQKEQIYLGDFEGWYSVSDETFYTPLQVEDELDPATNKPTGNKISTETGNIVTWLQEPNYKFRLSNFTQPLLNWIERENPIYPRARSNEIVSDLKLNGLKDLSISRLKEKIQWGIPVPGDDSHVIYVWIDALTNYLTACGYPHWQDTSKLSSLQKFWPASYHIVGKDIVKFHTIYWPAMLLAAGLPLPKKVVAHAHWTKDKKKISKSKGNTVEPKEVIAKYGVDPVRYILLRQGGLNSDGDYNDEEVQNLISAELANSLGNLIARVTSKGVNPSGEWPNFNEEALSLEERALIDRLRAVTQEVDAFYLNCEFGKAIPHVFLLINDANSYLTATAPWKLLPKKPKKDASDLANWTPPPLSPEVKIKYENSLYICLEAVRICTLLLQPVIPTLAASTLDFLGIPATHRNPFQHPFGVDYRHHSALAKQSGELFVLIDERDKKQAKFEAKQQNRPQAKPSQSGL